MFIAMIGLLLVSCERDITEPTISSSPAKPTLTNLSLNVPFTMANADSLVTFSWSAADFGFPSSITYAVQLSTNNNFSGEVAALLTTQDVKGTVKVNDINNAMLSWNKEIGQAVTLYYRVSASVTPSISVISETKSTSLTPFETLVDYPVIYVPGSYQGWSPGADNGRLYSYDLSKQKYGGIIRLVNGTEANTEFKITPAANWDNDWGGSLTQTGSNYSGTLVPKGSNLTVAGGVYEVEVDISALTISLTRTDDWGIIGSATSTGWDSDIDMFYNGQRKMWEITADFSAGEFKFRANDGWDLNYGDSGADGTLNAGGDNIALLSAGNYTIRFDPVKLTYTVKKN